MISGFASILAAVQSSHQAPAPHPADPSSSDSPPSFPPGAQVESQSVQELEDPPITGQDPVPEVP